MQTRKPAILNHTITQIPPFVTLDTLPIPKWTGIAGRHIGDGQFIHYPDAAKTYTIGSTWDTAWDETIWFSADCIIPETFIGQKMYLDLEFGGETIVRINGKIAGNITSDRADWIYRDKVFLPDPLPEDRILHIELESTVNNASFFDAAIDVGKEL